MKQVFITSAMALCLLSCGTSSNQIELSKFGAIPNDSKDDTQAILSALDECHKIKKPTLIFENGEYDISTEKARKAWHRIVTSAIAGKESWSGAPPKGIEGWPSEKGTIIELKDFDNLTIEGNGALLLIDGMAQPISAVNCNDLLIQNLKIDYKHQPAVTAKIVDCGEMFIEVQGMNRNIIIENNQFSKAHGYAIWAKQCKNIYICKNKFEDCPNALWIEQSEDIQVDDNQIEKDANIVINEKKQ